MYAGSDEHAVLHTWKLDTQRGLQLTTKLKNNHKRERVERVVEEAPHLHMFTDDCAKQYKGRRNFRFLSNSVRELGFVVEHHFAATFHFKGCPDGIGGVAKSAMKRAEKHNHVITGAAGVVEFLKHYFEKLGKRATEDYFASCTLYRIRRAHVKLIGPKAIYRPKPTLKGMIRTRDTYVFVGANEPTLNASTSTRRRRNPQVSDVVNKDWSLAKAVDVGLV